MAELYFDFLIFPFPLNSWNNSYWNLSKLGHSL